MSSLLPAVADGAPDRPALRFGARSLTYAELRAATGDLATRLKRGAAGRRLGHPHVWRPRSPWWRRCWRGSAVVPLNPKSGEEELGHIVADSAPSLLLAAPDDAATRAARRHRRALDIDVPAEHAAHGRDRATAARTRPRRHRVHRLHLRHHRPAQGRASSRAAPIAAPWTRWPTPGSGPADDVLVHGLPLFHVHGLILGILGPLRRGGSVRHLGRFGTEGVARELADGATMLFGVPTMYHRIAEALPDEPELAAALAGRPAAGVGLRRAARARPRSASPPRPAARVIERYGMTETLMNTSVRADGEPRPGTVGVPLPGVELRLVDEDGAARIGRRTDGTEGPSARSRCAARTCSPST